MDSGIGLLDFLIEAELQHYYSPIKSELKILKTSQLKYVTEEDLAQLGMSRPEQRRLKKFFAKHHPQNYLSRFKRLLGPGKKDENASSLGSLSEERVQDLNTGMSSEIVNRVPNKHIISAESITINKELGVGEFGVVQQGVWTNEGNRIQVAIKCLSRERMHTNSKEFLKEAAIMYSIEHKNVVRLYGVVLHLDSLMLVTELAPLRSLLECLKEVSLRPSFPVLTLCEFAIQICEGMTYLENKRLIHRDLAARNILVFTKNKVKISDFGLSRALGVGKDYYQTNFNVNLKLPIAWCAPECISYLRFTSASDVWAFAVTLWEMFSYGFQPWAAFSGHQILVAIDAPNYQRLEQPECCPKEYFALMQKCWQHEPAKRLKFSEILTMLPECRPEQVQAVSSSDLDPNTKRPDQLSYKGGDIITVLDKGANSASPFWKGVLDNGSTGYFNPLNIVSYLGSSLPSSCPQNVFMRSTASSENTGTSLRNSLIKFDRDRSNTKRRLRSCMISSPQGEVKHTSHVGLDGAYFGDVSFLEYNRLPRQVVTPYKPSEDLEQTPLINPNSPSHLTANNPALTSLSPYTILKNFTSKQYNSNGENAEGNTSGEFVNLKHASEDDVDSGYGAASLHPSGIVPSLNINFDKPLPKCLNLKDPIGGPNTNYECNTLEYEIASQSDVLQHEYQEISDEDDQKPSDNGSMFRNHSLLDEIELMFPSLSCSRQQPVSANQDHEGTNLKNELTEMSTKLSHTATLSKKKKTTVKPISAHDQLMLDSAIEYANQLTARSMTHLDHNDAPHTPTSPSEKSKFSFRFPIPGASHGTLKMSENCAKTMKGSGKEKRNFSQEAQSVPDIQSSLSEESKMAYESLVEQPYNSRITSLIHMRQAASEASGNMTDFKQPPSLSETHMVLKLPAHCSSNKIQHHHDDYANAEMSILNTNLEPFSKDVEAEKMNQHIVNAIPLPPRDKTKPQNSMKRHTREHPLVIKDDLHQRSTDIPEYRNNIEPSLDNTGHLHTNNLINANECNNENVTHKNNVVHNAHYSVHGSHFVHRPSKIGQYQNIISCEEDSFDTPSLKFEAQLENNFDSADCCDGMTCDFDCETKSSDSPINTDTNSQDRMLIDQDANAQCDLYTAEVTVNDKNKTVPSLSNVSDLLVDYIDSSTVALNPFEQKVDEQKSFNPFSHGAIHKRSILPPLKQVPNELASNALFNKVKADLQDNPTNSNNFSSRGHKDFHLKVGDSKTTESIDGPSVVDIAMSDWPGQRRTVSENLDDVESTMCMKGSPDRVSVEDLLEFSRQTSNGRQRGTESDEVRIMCKVLNQQVSKETCLKILDFASWDVHRAIKLAKLQCIGNEGPTLYECSAALDDCCGDGAKAAALIAAHCDISDIALV